MTDIFGAGVVARRLTQVHPRHYRSLSDCGGERKKINATQSIIPERADDRPAVVASVDLELVGVGEAKDLAVPQPEHVGRIFVLGAGASEIALHGDGFAQR